MTIKARPEMGENNWQAFCVYLSSPSGEVLNVVRWGSDRRDGARPGETFGSRQEVLEWISSKGYAMDE